jgi:cystathionine beta-lyase/cystathionine gamma-synthase
VVELLEMFNQDMNVSRNVESSGPVINLQALREDLALGRQLLALFIGLPGYPMLDEKSLREIGALAEQYDFPIVCVDILGLFVNRDLFTYAHITIASLGSFFSGRCNVSGGW